MNAKIRRRIHFVVFLIWLGPGAAASFFWAHSVAWVVAMSWFACFYSAASAYSAETPVEEERDSE